MNTNIELYTDGEGGRQSSTALWCLCLCYPVKLGSPQVWTAGQLSDAVCCGEFVVGDLEGVQDWEAAYAEGWQRDRGSRAHSEAQYEHTVRLSMSTQ